MADEFVVRKGLIIKTVTTGTTEADVLVKSSTDLVKVNPQDNFVLNITDVWSGTDKIMGIATLTQAEYDAIPVKNPNILYILSGTTFTSPSVTPSVSISSTPSISVTSSVTPSVTPSITPSISRTPSVTPSRTPSVTPSRTPSTTPPERYYYYVDSYYCSYPYCQYYIDSFTIENNTELTVGNYYIYDTNTIYYISYTASSGDYLTYLNPYEYYTDCDQACSNT